MDVAPEKFFIGLVDFFSILLPGALLTYLLKDDAGARIFGPGRYSGLGGTEGWAIFLFISYLAGHLIFLIGSWLLDDYVYDPIRQATYARQVECLAEGQSLSPILARWLAGLVFKKNVDDALIQAERIKRRQLVSLPGRSGVNTFQWSKAILALSHVEALATVQRFEADSKFFRSFIIVLCVLIPWEFVAKRSDPGAAMLILIAGAILLVLAFWRYKDQRVKATNQAYWFIITLESGRTPAKEIPQNEEKPLTHAGGVVVKRAHGHLEFLLVQAKNKPQEWVLPKGHIEPGEPIPQTAVREVREETGVWAHITGELGDLSYTVKGEDVRVRFYLMEFETEEKPEDSGREHLWLPLESAVSKAAHDQNKGLLKAANEKYSELGL
jgi:8-oxo-dGTP pyrophosphatase MutT (NUDIX family)